MEMKKAEMDNSISNGSFGEWIDHQTDANSNKNVYEYYRVRGEAPNMVFDSTSGKYIMQNPDSVGVAWYASSTGIAAIVGMSAAVATASFVAFKKSVRK